MCRFVRARTGSASASDRALEGDSRFVSAVVAVARRGQRMGNVGAGIWRDVEARCFAPEEGGTRHPQTGNCGAPVGASMFTQVNVRSINKFSHSPNEHSSER